jgi:hypothetical protein
MQHSPRLNEGFLLQGKAELRAFSDLHVRQKKKYLKFVLLLPANRSSLFASKH